MTSMPDDRAPDPLHESWTQRSVYGGPLWADTFGDLARRISVGTHHGGLILLDEQDVPGLAHLLRFLGIGEDRHYEVTRTTSTRPLIDGYLTCLRFTPATGRPAVAQPVGLATAMTAFVAAELATDLARTLVEGSYLNEPAGGPLWLVGYPALDQGPLAVGFALLVDDRPQWTYRLWSRVNHYGDER
jgi:hypothetical protein